MGVLDLPSLPFIQLDQRYAQKSYVDSLAVGLSPKPDCVVATTAALPTVVYNNSLGTLTGASVGVLTIDSYSVNVTDKILVKDQVDQTQNGIYQCTTAGAAGTAFVLTRITEMNENSEIPGAYTFVTNGTVNANKAFVVSGSGPFTLGATNIPWIQFSDGGYRKLFNDIATAKTASYTAAVWDSATFDTSGGAISQALPSTPLKDEEIEFFASYNTSGNILTVTGTGGPFTIYPGHGVTFRWNGSVWIERQDRKTLASLDARYAIQTANAINMVELGADPSGNVACDSVFAAAIVLAKAGPFGKIRAIYFPAGRYKLTSAVTPYSGMTLIGDGGEKEFGRRTVIYNTSTDIFTYAADISDVYIQGICFNGNGTTVTDLTTTASSTAVSSPGGNFTSAMNGKAIKGIGVTGGTTFTYVSATSGTLSQNAYASGTGQTTLIGGGTSFLTPNNTNNLNDWTIKDCGFNYFQPVWASTWLRPWISHCYFDNNFYTSSYSMLTFSGSDGTVEDCFIGSSYFPGNPTVAFLVDFNAFHRSWFRGNYVTPTPVMGLRVLNAHAVTITGNEFDANDPSINGTTIKGCDASPVLIQSSWGVTLNGNITSLASMNPFSFYTGNINIVDSQAVTVNGHIMDSSGGTCIRVNQAAGVVDNVVFRGTVYRNCQPLTSVNGTVTNFRDDTYGEFGQILAKSSNYSMGILDGMIQGTSGTGGITITLPTPAFKKTVRVGKADSAAGVVTIATPSGSITGPSTVGGQGEYETYISDGTNYTALSVYASSTTAQGLHRNTDSATYGAWFTFGNAANSIGFAGTGTPAEGYGPLVVYQNYGTNNGANASVTKTTQGMYVLTNYFGPTADDSAEGLSSFVGIKDTGTGFAQTKPVTAFEGISQIEGANTALTGVTGMVLGVGSRVNAVGTSHISVAAGFKASVNSSGGPTFGTIDTYYAFYQPAAASANGGTVTNAYGLYVIDAANSETSLSVGKSAGTAFKVKYGGQGDGSNSLALLQQPVLTYGTLASGYTLSTTPQNLTTNSGCTLPAGGGTFMMDTGLRTIVTYTAFSGTTISNATIASGTLSVTSGQALVDPNAVNVTALRLGAHPAQSKNTMEMWDGTSNLRFRINSAGNVITQGTDFFAANGSGTNLVRISGSAGYLQPGTSAGVGGRIYSGTNAPGTVSGSAGGDTFQRTDTPTVPGQRMYIATAANTWTPLDIPPTRVTSTSDTFANTDQILVVNSSSPTTITLPAANAIVVGKQCVIVNKGTGTVTISGTLSGTASRTLAQWAAFTFFSDGTDYSLT